MSGESIAAEVALCGNMFERLRALSLDPPGVSRASFGPGERLAHALAKSIAAAQGCECHTDFAGNLYMTIPGSDRTAPAVMMGSHLDSVPHGGNFDGAAGVAAGLGVLARLRRLGRQPLRDVTVMAIRAEEMSWFPTHYVGSRAAFGLLPPESLDNVLRRDTGRSLASHMAEEGFEPDKVRAGISAIDPRQVRCFLELHIEQGPVLVESRLPVGIVTGIRGNVRRKQCRVRGEWGHAGAVPRSARHDALLGAVAFVSALEELWIGYERAGHDFVATIGEFSTDTELHAIVKIPGEVRFTIDIRSEEEEILTDAERRLAELALSIGNRRGLAIDLGPFTRASAALMDPDLRRRLWQLARRQSIPVADIQSGGGHDCAVFANLGIPSAMIFVRNDHGSHNPDEAMELSDFAQAMQLLMSLVDELVLT